MSQYKPVADLKVKTREYQDKDTGKVKGVWSTVGTLWETPHASSRFITIESIPITIFKDGEKVPFDGRISIFDRDDGREADQTTTPKPSTQDVVPDDIDDQPIDLSKVDIPF